MRRRRSGHLGAFLALALAGALVLVVPVREAAAQPQGQESVVVDGHSPGRTFDGLGAVSAGASSRLLYDYPEPERSQILDYLFKPNYGAALQLLKVEIGGDINSTSGAEPSHMRSPGEVDCDRGYEWWLMREAKKRNPAVRLGGLQWGAPGWFDGGFWSQDNIDYLLAWLGCAEENGIEIDFMGGWNEAGYDQDWFVAWSRALREHYPGVEVAAADDTPDRGWRVARDMAANPAFGAAVDIANLHSPCGHRTLYLACSSTDTARALGKPLWIGELSSMAHDAGAAALARAANRMYVDARLTGMMAWSPISAWYANITLADTGLMVAEWPWSGHYDVGDSIWAYAHTTQFAQPGWRYLDTGSRRLRSGATQVALASPDGRDWSVVIETMDAGGPDTVTYEVRNLPARPMRLWSTDLRSPDDADRFRYLGTVEPTDGELSLRLEPGHIYTVTTTEGQLKGDARPSASVHQQLGLPLHETFEQVAQGRAARFFADLAGAFEAAPCGGGREGMCYRQTVDREPITWSLVGALPLSTMFGDPRWWGDYAVSADVMLERPGHVEIGGRVSGQSWGSAPSGYHFRVGTDGWALFSRDHAGRSEVRLAAGDERVAVGTWHEVALRMRGDSISLYLDGRRLARITDSAQRTGNAALGVSAWDNAQFDDVRVVPTGPAPQFVPKESISATATSEHGFHRGWTYGVEHVVDDRSETAWSSAFDPPAGLPQAVTLDLGREREIQALTYQPRLDGNTSGMISSYEVRLSRDGERFYPAASGTWSRDSSTKIAAWPAQPARYVRLVAVNDSRSCGADTAAAGELGVVLASGPELTTTPPTRSGSLPSDAPPEFDQVVPQSEMTATASSVHSPPYLACKAVDGDASTFWHSAPAATRPLPASVTLDLGHAYPVRGLSYLPRQDGNPNGTITAYEIAASADGEAFTPVAHGAWPDDPRRKYVTWQPTPARYLRLTATAGHFNVAAAAELHVAIRR